MSIFFPVPTCDVYPSEIASRTCWAFIQRVFFLLTMSFGALRFLKHQGNM